MSSEQISTTIQRLNPWAFKDQPAPPPRQGKPRLLCLADQPGWAFDNGHRDCERHLSSLYDFTHHLITAPLPDLDPFDLIYSPYCFWAVRDMLPKSKTVGAFRSTHLPVSGQQEIDLINSFKAFQVVTRADYDRLRPHCPRLHWLPNPVNLDKFPDVSTVAAEQGLVCEWSGNSTRTAVVDDKGTREPVKGLHEFIVPACEAAGVPLRVADYSIREEDCPGHAWRRRPHEEMPAWVLKASCLVHTSMFEGCSKVLLEAMASGLAVVSTEVGQVGEMFRGQLRDHGRSGIILVDRDVEQITAVLRMLKDRPELVAEMGALNRAEMGRWSWERWAPAYDLFFQEGLR